MGVEPLAASFPEPLMESARQVWRGGLQRSGYLSKMHEEVSRVLWRMGVLHRNEHVMCTMFCVDIALEGDKVRLQPFGGWGPCPCPPSVAEGPVLMWNSCLDVRGRPVA